MTLPTETTIEPQRLHELTQKEREYDTWKPIIDTLKEWSVDPEKDRSEVRVMVKRWFAWP